VRVQDLPKELQAQVRRLLANEKHPAVGATTLLRRPFRHATGVFRRRGPASAGLNRTEAEYLETLRRRWKSGDLLHVSEHEPVKRTPSRWFGAGHPPDGWRNPP
jgi:hypothetical protein